MAGFEPTYEGIQEMILRDQYFLTCDKSLHIFLKEKRQLSLKEITKVSNDYFEAHGYPAKNHEKKINGVSNKAYTKVQLSLNVHRIRFSLTSSIRVLLSGLKLHVQSDRDKTLQVAQSFQFYQHQISSRNSDRDTPAGVLNIGWL